LASGLATDSGAEPRGDVVELFTQTTCAFFAPLALFKAILADAARYTCRANFCAWPERDPDERPDGETGEQDSDDE